MGLKEYFDIGRQQEIAYERKQQARKVIKRVKKPSPYSPAGLIIGAGVLYQILYPYLSPIGRLMHNLKANVIIPTWEVIKIDFKRLGHKVKKVDPEFENYSHFEDLAKAGKKE